MRFKSVTLLFVVMLFGFTPSAPAQDYHVGEGDMLKITVYDHEDLTTTVRVSGDDTIDFPLIGQVRVAGMKASQVADSITKLLADGYIINPHVTVFVEEFRSKKVTVLGQVTSPGLYELRQHTSILELISKAGGLSKDAGNEATIKRKKNDVDNGKDIIRIDLKKLIEKGDMTLNTEIQDGDIVNIKKAELIYVNGEVRSAGAYKYEEGITVIKAITIAGGLSEKAAPTRVKIIRKASGKEEVICDVKMDKSLMPDDIIVVPESYF
jgi:polysaccharide biosynthesis/export protein